MKRAHLVVKIFVYVLMLGSATASAITIGPELVSDPGFDDPASWNVGIGSSSVQNGQLVVINYSGFIFPVPGIDTEIGKTYQYMLTVDLVNNLSGGGRVTVGGQTIWEPGYDTGIFTGTILATDTGGLVFNFLTPYLGRAEFDSVSVAAVIPITPAIWLFGSGLLGLVGLAKRNKA